MTLRSSKPSLAHSSSWLGTLAQPSAFDAKFSTVALGGRRSRPGLFSEELSSSPRSGSRSRRGEDELAELQGLGEEEHAAWVVTVAEGPKARSRNRKPDPVLTVYCSTPTSSLTLSRKLSEIVDLEARLRAQFPDRLPSRKPSSSIPSTPKKRNNVLASLSRTLSPRRGGPSSFTSASAAVDVKDLGALLTKASADSTVRSHTAWKSFFRIRSDDLESARVERRIKRARSDQTMHLAPTPDSPPAVPELPMAARLARQDASGGTEMSASSAMTDEVLRASGEEKQLSLFDLPDIPSASIKIDTPQVATPDDVELVDAAPVEEEEPVPMAEEPLEVEAEEPVAPSTPAPKSPPTSAGPPDERVVAEAVTAQSVAAELVAVEPVAVPIEPLRLPPKPAKQEQSEGMKRSKSEQQSLAPPSTTGTSAAMSRSPSDLSTRSFEKKPGTVTLDSFDIMRVLGKGCAGKVLLVKEKKSGMLLALKAITKRHVLAHRELLHTRTEQSVLKTCARDQSNPFVVRLHYSFHDADTLYLALDFHPGGDLATQLARWGRLGRDRTRFYIAEIVEGVEGLHRAGIIYRDLKPENILISYDGHIVLTDFGLSKDFGHKRVEPPASASDGLPRPHWLDHPSRSASTPPSSAWAFGRRETTTSFCGTAEYLAPEVLLGEPYSYEVDTWSAGTLLYEMLVGVTPFYAEDHATMYRRVLHDDLVFDDPRVFGEHTKALIRGMLQRDPLLRMTDARIKKSRFFDGISWEHIYHKRYAPPFVPTLNPDDPTDLSQFDDVFLSMPAEIKGDPEDEPGSGRDAPEGEPQAATDEHGRDVFDGYSYFGRDSASIHRHKMEDEDEESEKEGGDGVDEEDEETDSPAAGSQADLDEDEDVSPERSEPRRSGDRGGSDLVEEDDPEPDTPKVAGPVDAASPRPSTDLVSTASSRPSTELSDAREHDRMLTSTPPEPHLRAPSSDVETSIGLGDLSLSSLATGTTADTSFASDSPVAVRNRQHSSRSNLEPLQEEPPRSVKSASILVEEAEDEPSDSEWDVVHVGEAEASVRNGGKEATFFARGIKDRYRLVLAPLGSPARQSTLRPSRQNSHVGSSTSIQSALSSLSPSPEPPSGSSFGPAGAIRRLASVRSSTSGSGKSNGLRTKKSQRSLGETGSAPGRRTAPPSPRVDTKLFKRRAVASTSTPAPTVPDTPRKSALAFKKFAKSAFLSSSTTSSSTDKA
ncbi:hypothetical protein JCM8097_000571 [Rhodosporidiobolus ruineniae]